MQVFRNRYVVIGEDGSETTVIADQRDIVKFERDEKIAFSLALPQMATALDWILAYNALQRTKAIKPDLSREEWEAGVVQVMQPPEDEDGDEPDPGSPEA